MDVDEYRKTYEKELAAESASPAPADGTPGDPASITQNIAVLRDPGKPVATRVEALHALKAAAFLGPAFAPYRADFLAALRDILRPATDATLREHALETLALEKDPQAQEQLRRGLLDAAAALIPPAKALKFLGYDDHAAVVDLAREIFHRSSDGAVKQEALRLLSADPSSVDLLTSLLKDKSQDRAIRAISATAMLHLDPHRFVDIARDIVTDDKDYEDIRATALGALAHLADRQDLHGDSRFMDRVKELASAPLQNLRASAGRFMQKLQK